MRRIASLLALVVVGSCRGAGPAQLPVPQGAQPLIRVGIIVDRDSAMISGTGQFRLEDAGGGTIAVSDPRQVWWVRQGEPGRLLFYREGREAPLDLPVPVLVVPERPGEDLLAKGYPFHGDFVLIRGSAGLTVINRVPLELYLQSVVAMELGFRAPSDRQAVMAQAVAARTFAVRYRGRREALGFDVFATDADQAYSGSQAELPEVTDAVRRTQGQILTFQGRPIQALFHSTCGFSTESGEEVFQNGEAVPYLRAVSDRYGDGDHDFYCNISPRFRWREEWSADDLSSILARTIAIGRSGGGATPAGGIGRVTDISISRTSSSGRVSALLISTTTGQYTVTSHIRDVLKGVPDRQLNSTLFQLQVQKTGDSLTRVVALGAGYGHGVGMCQFGAVGRSRAGQDYQQILATYYQGTQLERLY